MPSSGCSAIPTRAFPKPSSLTKILHFIEIWKRDTGELPTELIFDSQLTTQENLSRLNRQGIFFITPPHASDAGRHL